MGDGELVIGILMLDCEHSDVPGCAGSDATFPFRVKRKVVPGATVERMTGGGADLEEQVIRTAEALESDGVDAVMGDCGFMAVFQRPLQARLRIPVFSSSLLLVPLIASMLPRDKRIGILTYRASTLGETQFCGAGWSSRDIAVAVAGVDDKPTWRVLAEPEHPFPYDDLEAELLGVCGELARRHGDIGAILLECTVMPPFAHAIQAALGVPVFDITSLAALVAGAMARGRFVKHTQVSL